MSVLCREVTKWCEGVWYSGGVGVCCMVQVSLVFHPSHLPSTETTLLSVCADVHNKGLITTKSGGG